MSIRIGSSPSSETQPSNRRPVRVRLPLPFFHAAYQIWARNERVVGHVASQTGLIVLYRTLKRCHFPSTPLSVCVPASSNPRPAPATRSFNVLETKTSFALALAATLEAV